MEDQKKYLNELRFLTPEEIAALAEKIIADSTKVQDAVAALQDGEHTFANTVKALANDELISDTLAANCYFPSYVSTDKATRDASTEANKKIEAFGIESNMREDVYQSLLKYKAKGEQLGPVDQRLLDKQLETFERNGLGLPKEEREKLKALKKRMSELCIQFQQNINEDKTSREFTKEELAGMPDDFIESLGKSEDGQKYVVTLKYPEVFPLLQKAINEETRKTMEFADSTQCMKENAPILEEVIKLRHQAAQLLGFPTHADYILKIRMAKSVQNVLEFENGLKDKLIPFGLKEKEKLLKLKEEEKKELGHSFDGEINAWDFRYYHRLLLEKEYEVNDDEIKEYFPIEVVTKALLEIYQEILGFRFEEVEKPYVWHEDVQLFSVCDKDSNDFIGHFYLDLYPRDGKYTHAAAFPLQPTGIKSDGSRQHPAAAMVANFSKPGKDRPSLLKHSEVVTYFHEFGHIMHNICSTVTYSRFAGTSVERDFVEAPSQMLENWCWEKDILYRLSGHYKDNSKHLPDNLLSKMVAAKNVNTGLLNLRQIFFGLYDQTIHSQPETDTAALWHKLKTEVSLVGSTPGTNPSASFGHLAGGYDAQYYGYLYSEVFSADMFSRFKKEGILSPKVGKEYREVILSRGGSVDSITSLVEFLGREPTQEAFLEHLGLTEPTSA